MREISTERLRKDTNRVLENPFWLSSLQEGKAYSRLHDDHDGTGIGNLSVFFDPNTGDAYVGISGPPGESLRFRKETGGTASPKVYNALMILAEAIRQDNEKRPAGDPKVFRKNRSSETGE